MADAVIGKAYLQVIPKLSLKSLGGESVKMGKQAGTDYGKGFSSGLSGVGDVAGKAFSTLTKAAAGAAATAGAAIAAIGKQAFDSYSSYEQLSGGISKLFGTAGMGLEEYAASQGQSIDAVADQYARLEQAQSLVMQNASEAYRTAGMSANEYMENVSGFAAALTSSLGGDTVKAAEQADVAMRAISDNVNTFGTDIDSVTTAFQGFAKQNYTMLDNLKLGYGGTKSEMERLIKDANEWGAANGKASDLSIDSFSDVITAIEQIQEKQQIAGTTAREAGTTIEGSINAAKGAWSNLLTEFGKSDGNVEGAMEALATSLVGDGTESNLGVFGNVIPRIATIVGNVAKQLPGMLMQLAPVVAKALTSVLDSATGGLASKVLDILSPVTDAIGEAFGGIGEWVDANKGSIDMVVESIEKFASAISEGLGTAIEIVSPIVGDLASAALPLLSAALDVAGGFITAVVDLFTNLVDAMSPIVDAVSPIVDAIGTWLVNALKDLGDGFSKCDFSGFGQALEDAMQGVVDFVGDAIESVTGFFDDVAKFLADPIGAIQDGFRKLMDGSTETERSVTSDFNALDSSVDSSLSGVEASIDSVNGKDINDKTASANVYGNAVDGTARVGVDNTDKAVDNLSGKTVDVSVTGNAKEWTVADRIWDTVKAIWNLQDKTVNVRTNTVISAMPMASGGIRYHADGFIANRYGAGVPLDIVGEDGAEAIIPLTNKRYTRPFADTVAEQMLSRMEGMGGVTVNLNYEAGADANDMARDIAYTLDLIRRTGA